MAFNGAVSGGFRPHVCMCVCMYVCMYKVAVIDFVCLAVALTQSLPRRFAVKGTLH